MECIAGHVPASHRFRQGSWSAFHLLYKRARGGTLGEDIETVRMLMENLDLY